MRLSAVHSTSVARTVSLDIKEHSGRSAMGVTSADHRNGTIGDGRVMPDRARPQSSPLPCLVGPDGRGRVAGSGMTFLPCRR